MGSISFLEISFEMPLFKTSLAKKKKNKKKNHQKKKKKQRRIPLS